jgi:hypothetical protein
MFGTTMDALRRAVIVLPAILVAACGPGQPAGSGGNQDESSSSSSETSSSGTDGTGTSSTGDNEDSGDTDDGNNFITHDFEDTSCDPGKQDCPEGEKCTAYVMTPGYCCVDANKCVPVIGDKQLGDVCQRGEDNDDCAEGLFCMTKTSGDPGEGVCLAFCDIDEPNACDDLGLLHPNCIEFNDGVLPLCEGQCNPIDPDCPDPQGCYAVGEWFICSLPSFEGPWYDDDGCFTIQSCAPGLHCAPGTETNGCMSNDCCTPWCDVSQGAMNNPACPDAAEQCVQWDWGGEEIPSGFEDVGYCRLP